MSLLLALLQAAPQPPQPQPEQAALADGGGGFASHRTRSRAVPGWAVPMLNLQLEPTADQKAARTRRQLRQLRMLRRI